MRLIHTSDWHLGRSLYGRRRIEEFAAFLDWLAEQAERQQADVLLVAGDIFDTVTPGNKSQELYYGFLCRIARSCCRHVVVTAGNHDSPSFLEAPRMLLHLMQVHVIGVPTDCPEDEVIVLRDREDQPEAIVCAVPYLRDRDIRTVEAGESVDDKNARLIAGIKDHYEAVCAAAEHMRGQLGELPLIAMGHLFAAGGRTVDGDGVRDLYVGTLAHVPASLFPDSIDYLALGHLHVAQMVGNNPCRRYAGSPLPMGFGEADQEKKVLLVDFAGRSAAVTELAVPCFQPLARVAGSIEQILDRLEHLKAVQSHAWIEVVYTGQALAPDLRERVETVVSGSGLEIRRIKNRQVIERVLEAMSQEENLEELDVLDVFGRCLDQAGIAVEERPDLLLAYQEILADLTQEDTQAEG